LHIYTNPLAEKFFENFCGFYRLIADICILEDFDIFERSKKCRMQCLPKVSN
jgi:hypothetical protein